VVLADNMWFLLCYLAPALSDFLEKVRVIFLTSGLRRAAPRPLRRSWAIVVILDMAFAVRRRRVKKSEIRSRPLRGKERNSWLMFDLFWASNSETLPKLDPSDPRRAVCKHRLDIACRSPRYLKRLILETRNASEISPLTTMPYPSFM